MTDGIIQKVFNNIIDKHSFGGDNNNNQLFSNTYYDKAVRLLLNELQQELIAKIDDLANDLMLTSLQRNILIG